MANDLYTILDWDTDVLGIPTARIEPGQLNEVQLKELLGELKNQNIKLVYWASDSNDEKSQEAARAFNGVLADKKVTFEKSLTPIDSLPAGIHVSRDEVLNAELLSLAYSIGGESRFFLDTNLPRDAYQKVYKQWMINSLNRSVAKQVFVAIRDNKIAGVVTLCEKEGKGDIALIAVLPEYQGQGIATQLLNAASYYFNTSNFEKLQVVTQLTNHGACGLYEKYGFAIAKLEYFYHFWV